MLNAPHVALMLDVFVSSLKLMCVALIHVVLVLSLTSPTLASLKKGITTVRMERACLFRRIPLWKKVIGSSHHPSTLNHSTSMRRATYLNAWLKHLLGTLLRKSMTPSLRHSETSRTSFRRTPLMYF